MKIVKRLLFISIILLIIVSGVGYYLVVNVAAYSPIKPMRNHAKVYLKQNQTLLLITTKDSLRLEAIYSSSLKCPFKGTVIIIHGIGGNKESQLSTADLLNLNGFNAVVIDLRAHGASEGKYCTFGYYEKFDISALIDSLISRSLADTCIGIMGHSLGGAVAVQTLAFDKRIKCGIVSSTFSNLNLIVFDYMKRISGVPFKFISDIVIKEAGDIAKFPVDSINPGDYARQIRQPVLYVHGDADERINVDYGEEIFNNLASTSKEFYIIKNANHNGLFEFGGDTYRKKIIDFFSTRLNCLN